MTLRQYAAIHLRVPNSGVEWLDEMIREANGQQSQLFVKKPGEPQFSTPNYMDGQWHDWQGGARDGAARQANYLVEPIVP